jgi:predicted PurR-regulated permease PerM
VHAVSNIEEAPAAAHAEPAAPAVQVAPAPPAQRIQHLRSLRLAAWILVGIAIAYTLHLAATLLLPILLAAMLAVLLTPPVAALTRYGVPQYVAAAMVVIASIAALAILGLYLYAPVQRWLDAGPAELRRIESKVRLLKRPVTAVKEATEKVAEMASVDPGSKPRPPTVAVESGGITQLLTATQTGLLMVLTTILLVYFLLSAGDLFLRNLVRVIPRLRDKIRAVEIARDVQREIGRYFATFTLINAGLGAVTGVALWLLGMPTPLLWAVAVMLLNYLPYVGPLVGAVLIGAVSLVTFDTPLAILAPLGVYLILLVIEDQVVMPLVMGRSLALSPVLIFLWVLVWTWMWGIAGVLLAVPLLVAVRICAERVPGLAPLALLLSRN